MSRKARSKEMFRGSIIRLRRRCGKPNCRCADGDLHESWALSYSVKGRTRMLPLSEQDIPRVERGIELYKKESAALQGRALKGIEGLRKERAARGKKSK